MMIIEMKTRIIFEDDSVLVCYKPAGLATQAAGVGQMDMVSELKGYLAGKTTGSNKGVGRPELSRGGVYLGVIHRLDQPVEGLLVFAKTSQAAAKLSAQLAQGTLNKHYRAVVCGQPQQKQGELVDYLGKDAIQKKAVADAFGPEAKKAVLQYRVLHSIAEPEPVSLLDVHIDTGRFHQIRAQLSHAGWPILGDSKYGSALSESVSREFFVRTAALCACALTFRHPKTGKELRFYEEPQGKIFRLFSEKNEVEE